MREGTDDSDSERMRELIAGEARAAGMPETIALAFAWIESRFDPKATGDLKWHEKRGGQLYVTKVRDRPYFKSNPARLEPAQWFARGLFQLLPAYHAKSLEHPDVLFDPKINAQRGIAHIKELLRRNKGDPLVARLYYTGAIGGSSELQEETKKRMTQALARFGWSAPNV